MMSVLCKQRNKDDRRTLERTKTLKEDQSRPSSSLSSRGWDTIGHSVMTMLTCDQQVRG